MESAGHQYVCSDGPKVFYLQFTTGQLYEAFYVHCCMQYSLSLHHKMVTGRSHCHHSVECGTIIDGVTKDCN